MGDCEHSLAHGMVGTRSLRSRSLGSIGAETTTIGVSLLRTNLHDFCVAGLRQEHDDLHSADRPIVRQSPRAQQGTTNDDFVTYASPAAAHTIYDSNEHVIRAWFTFELMLPRAQ